jgi:hypothetical protein
VGDCIDPEDLPALEGERCASVGGVSLHANVAVPARDRLRLERLCRYVARPPVATERLSRLADGRLLYRLKHRWRDGTSSPRNSSRSSWRWLIRLIRRDAPWNPLDRGRQVAANAARRSIHERRTARMRR